MTTSPETANLNLRVLRRLVDKSNSLPLRDRITLLKALMPGVAQEVTPCEFETIVTELRLKGERLYDAVSHPGHGRRDRNVIGERDFEGR